MTAIAIAKPRLKGGFSFGDDHDAADRDIPAVFLAGIALELGAEGQAYGKTSAVPGKETVGTAGCFGRGRTCEQGWGGWVDVARDEWS